MRDGLSRLVRDSLSVRAGQAALSGTPFRLKCPARLLPPGENVNIFWEGCGLLYGGGEERAASVCGDAAAIFYHAYHAVEMYVAA
jgi:hypothetical protein